VRSSTIKAAARGYGLGLVGTKACSENSTPARWDLRRTLVLSGRGEQSEPGPLQHVVRRTL